MTRNLLLFSIFAVLGYGFWISPDFNTIAAGVAIFLLGMLSLEKGFKSFSGGVLANFLQRTTDATWKSLSFGVVATTIMQSSSLVSVLTISFLSAGLIPLAQGIGIIFGANLGTTTGAWLVAGLGLKVDIAAYALPMLVFGVIMVFQKNHKHFTAAGWALIGLGFLFLGIAYMKDGFESVSTGLDLSQYAVPGFRGLMIYAAIGIAMTVVMQSSHATLILTITALAAGQVSYENALALAIGSNVGTTITAIIGAISASVSGRQLALAHLFFNLVTGALAIVFINQFVVAVDWLSNLVGIAADNYTLKFAVFHTLFNLARRGADGTAHQSHGGGAAETAAREGRAGRDHTGPLSQQVRTGISGYGPGGHCQGDGAPCRQCLRDTGAWPEPASYGYHLERRHQCRDRGVH